MLQSSGSVGLSLIVWGLCGVLALLGKYEIFLLLNIYSKKVLNYCSVSFQYFYYQININKYGKEHFLLNEVLSVHRCVFNKLHAQGFFSL